MDAHKQGSLSNTPSFTNCGYDKNDTAECDDKFTTVFPVLLNI